MEHKSKYQEIMEQLDLLYKMQEQLDQLAEDDFENAIADSVSRGNIYFDTDPDFLH